MNDTLKDLLAALKAYNAAIEQVKEEGEKVKEIIEQNYGKN